MVLRSIVGRPDLGRGGQAWLDNPRPGTGGLTQRHISNISGILSLSRIREQPVPVGCCFAGPGNRHGEDHDENGTDRPRGSVIFGRGHNCGGSKWSSHWRISTRAVEPQSLWLRPPWLLQLLRPTPLSAPLPSLVRLAVAWRIKSWEEQHSRVLAGKALPTE